MKRHPTKNPKSNDADVLVRQQGGLTTISLRTEAARQWWRDHITHEGLDAVVELKVNDQHITSRMEDDELTVADDDG